MQTKPIAIQTAFSWAASKAISIEENGEPLVPVSYCPDRVLTRPQYFYQKMPHALPETYLREGVFERLLKASEHLPKGCRFVIFDGWRPLSLQEDLFEQYKKELADSNPELNDTALSEATARFVARPDRNLASPSPHSTGGAVDLSIADAGGKLLHMGTGFDDTSERSKTTYFEKRVADGETLSETEEQALRNRRLLFHIMSATGFTNYPDEWWHFDYGNQNWALISGAGRAVYGKAAPTLRWLTEEL